MFEEKPDPVGDETLNWILGAIGLLFLGGAHSGGFWAVGAAGGAWWGWILWALMGVGSIVMLWGWIMFFISLFMADAATTYRSWRTNLLSILANGAIALLNAIIITIVMAASRAWLGVGLGFGGVVSAVIAYFLGHFLLNVYYNYDEDGSWMESWDGEFDWFVFFLDDYSEEEEMVEEEVIVVTVDEDGDAEVTWE